MLYEAPHPVCGLDYPFTLSMMIRGSDAARLVSILSRLTSRQTWLGIATETRFPDFEQFCIASFPGEHSSSSQVRCVCQYPVLVTLMPTSWSFLPRLGTIPLWLYTRKPAHSGSRRCAIILESSGGACRQVFDLSKTDNEFPNLEASVAEVRRLRDENARLRRL